MKIPALAFIKRDPKPLKKNTRSVTHDERGLIEVCVLPQQEALAKLESTAQGLDAEEAARRLDEYGLNELAYAERLGFWADIFRRLRNPLNIQLLLIAGISGAIGELKSTFIVSAMVVLSYSLSHSRATTAIRATHTFHRK